MSPKTNAPQTIDPQEFLDQPEVKAAMDELKVKFLDKKVIVSDVLDEEGNQYVNLVQEGGGVLGVALVGYTYVLEEMGVRFMRLAGTSAGAINTALMAVIGGKESKKSETILKHLSGKNLFDFVDGHPVAKKMIRNFITNKSFVKQSMQWIKRLFLALGALVFISVVGLGLQHHFAWFSVVTRISFVLTGALLLIVTYFGLYTRYLMGRFKDCGFGINPGDDFHEWVKGIMNANDVNTIEKLKSKTGKLPQGVCVRGRNSSIESLRSLNPDITLITSDIITENKIEFPKMYDLFTDKPGQIDGPLHPADFVRASMSIPIFFESFVINKIDANNETIRKGWQTHFSIDPENIPHEARFVDGGVLSNFPMSIFYNPEVRVPRLPTFGVRLNDAEPEKKKKVNFSLGTYFGKLFNTVRYFYDKDFLLKNKLYSKGIGVIDVHEFNWLNFGLSNEEKKKLFLKGVLAAKEFLIGEKALDWAAYKKEREDLFETLHQSDENRKKEKESLTQTHI